MNRMELLYPSKHLPAAARVTYQLTAPLQTHWRPATCAEVDCPHYLNGWALRVEDLTQQDVYTATHCGRKWTEQRVGEGETWLIFDAGQPCFRASEHRTPLEREPLYIVRDGDHRGNPLGTEPRFHSKPELWVEDFAEHQQMLADAHQKG